MASRSKCALAAALLISSTILAPAASAPAAASAPTAQPLPLPESPATTCSAAAFYQATSAAPSCSDTMYNYKDPELSCCSALADFYGVNSTKPTRNCFCYEPYWTRLQELEEITYIQLMPYLDYCSSENMTIAYFGDASGLCAGTAANSTASSTSSSASAAAADTPHTSLRQWLRDLKGNGLMTLSFTFGLISAFGFVAMLWPLVADAGLQLLKIHAGRSSRSH